MSVPKIAVDADVLLAHSRGAASPSVLRQTLGKFFCYTTVFSAIEAFAACRTGSEIDAVTDTMAAMKVLGLNPKNARMYAGMLSGARSDATLHVLAAGLCIESRLPLLTGRVRNFRRFAGLHLVPSGLVARYASGVEILSVSGKKP